MKILRIAEVGN